MILQIKIQFYGEKYDFTEKIRCYGEKYDFTERNTKEQLMLAILQFYNCFITSSKMHSLRFYGFMILRFSITLKPAGPARLNYALK